MNEFVRECQNEWKRLGVPDSVAVEMATELAADLAEAEADGVSAEDVLGSGALDPRSFATAWAVERGLIERPLPDRQRPPSKRRLAAAIGAFALIATVGAVLMVLASPSTSRRSSLASPGGLRVVAPDGPDLSGFPPSAARAAVSPDGRHLALALDGMLQISPAEHSQVVTFRLPARATGIAAPEIHDSGAGTSRVGTVLLTLGLTGAVLLTTFWLWSGRARRSLDPGT